MPATFKRAGLHRLECGPCGTYTYATFAQLRDHAAPRCGECGESFYPERLELAELLGWDDAPVMVAFRRKCSSVAHGQAWTGRDSRTLPDASLVAYREITRQQRQESRKRRLSALMPTPEPMPF